AVPANYILKRVERPESEWDETKWRKSGFRDSDYIAKGKAKTQYLLTDHDLLPLSYHKERNNQGYNCMKMYRKKEIERRAWEKYGGHAALQVVKKEKRNRAKMPKPDSPAKKAASSTSKAQTDAKQSIIG
ncbi:hypothetical protein CPB84DRAFT_1779866, partial [Gymnopilus junonius]